MPSVIPRDVLHGASGRQDRLRVASHQGTLSDHAQ
jgi:hypothetical protein